MGVIINIDEALRLRSDYNVLREPLNEMIRNSQEAWERENPIDMIYNRSTIDSFQEQFSSSIGFDHAFTETNDYAIGPIFNTDEGFSAAYTTRTFQGSFIITQQALEDRKYGSIKDTANQFVRRWHGDIVEYAMAALSSGFGTEVVYSTANEGKTRLKLTSADTKTGDILDTTKNPLFYNKHTIVKRKGMSDSEVQAAYQSNIYYADIDLKSSDSARIAKLADAINQVITIMENYKDDNNKRSGLLGAKEIVCANDPHLKAAIQTALSMDMFKQGESAQINPAYQRATLKTTPYLNDIPQCKDGLGFFVIDRAYNAENHGLELTERIAFTLEVIDNKRPKGIIYDGRQRFDINVATWRGIVYVHLGTPAGTSSTDWNYKDNFTELELAEAIATPVTVVSTGTAMNSFSSTKTNALGTKTTK